MQFTLPSGQAETTEGGRGGRPLFEPRPVRRESGQVHPAESQAGLGASWAGPARTIHGPGFLGE